ncbi:MAG: hypothetical protein OEY01_05070 [Desulfobulbaceae bacterium]|nr:hypothetical protein [Desulfobulbaceae bacterium]
MTAKFWAGVVFFALFAILASAASGAELKTRYATVRYSDAELLRKFNDEFYLGRRLTYQLRGMEALTVADEVRNKLNVVVEKVEAVLDMFPPILAFTIVLLPTDDDVQAVYFKKYGKRVDHIAYYSLSEKTIYISVRDVNLQVLAHELGHVVVDHYFKVRPPYKIHEVLAQFAEVHITD